MTTEWICAVDRIEGSGTVAIAVLVGDDERVEEVPTRELGPLAIEGAVLRVPLRDGKPDWASARRDADEETQRRQALSARLKKLQEVDPGGDIDL
jgi:hypothetical protein